MPYTDKQIIEWATNGGVKPFRNWVVNPASIDLCLGSCWADFYAKKKVLYPLNSITLYPSNLRNELHNKLCNSLRLFSMLRPTVILTATHEIISIPNNAAASIKLKTTPTRKGLGHIVGDWVDPGYNGKLTLILFAIKEIELHYLQRICQLVLWELDDNVTKSYGEVGHYQNSEEPMLAYDEDTTFLQRWRL